MTRRARLLLAAAAAAACAGPGLHGGPTPRPAGDEGMVLYTVGRLTFEAPAAWRASGDARRVRLESEDGRALLDVAEAERHYASEGECLAQAEKSLSRGAADLTNVRRHPTVFAGRRAVTQEADQGRWHGWAFALCDVGNQYRVFFTGLSPLSEEAVAAYQALTASAQLSGSSVGSRSP